MSETGIKFTCERTTIEATPFAGFAQLNAYRQRLREIGFIGIDAKGIGFGNLSIRQGETNAFHITGSATGGKLKLSPGDYARVTACDFEKNWLRCEGAVASSESLTHAAIYEADADAGAVIHGHNLGLWSALTGNVPTISDVVEYGTPEMAREVQHLFRTSDVRNTKLFMMAGHREGLVSFGKDLKDAFAVLMRTKAEVTGGRG